MLKVVTGVNNIASSPDGEIGQNKSQNSTKGARIVSHGGGLCFEY